MRNENRHARLFSNLLLGFTMTALATMVGAILGVALTFVNVSIICFYSSSYCGSTAGHNLFLFMFGSGPVLGFIVGLLWSKYVLTETD